MTISVRSVASKLTVAGTLGLLVAGCEIPVSDQTLDAPLQLLDEITLSEFQTQLGLGPVRVEIKVDHEQLLARRIEVQSGEELGDEEEIISRVVALEVGDGRGRLTLALGDLEVEFTGETRFDLPNGEDVSMESFVGGLSEALAEGSEPPTRVERAPPDAPQAPDDATFVADRIRLLHEHERSEIEITIDTDNLTANDDPPPDGWITVLGLPLELRVSEGLTEIGEERPELEKMEFEGVIESVDLEEASFTLEDGTVVKLVDESDLDHGDEIPRLDRLEIVAQAIEAGLTVVAHGVGAVESRDPLVLVALRLRFGVRGDGLTEFRGQVTSVRVQDLAFELDDGTVVRLLDITHISGGGGDPEEALKRVLAALEENKKVNVHGVGIEVEEDPRVIVALKLEFGATTRVEDFRGEALSVDEFERTVTLVDGTVIQLTDETTIHQSDDEHVLGSLDEVLRALEAGETVLVRGVGVVESEDPLVLSAVRIVFVLKPPPLEHFDGVVASVDVGEMRVKLGDGTIVRLDEQTSIHQGDFNDEHVLGSLGAVAEALEAGATVMTGGIGLVESEEPLTILAREIVFVAKRPGLEHFEGVVAAVDVDAGRVALRDGTILVVGPDTKFHFNDFRPVPLGSLEAVARALEAGETVVALGLGKVISDEPRTIEVAEVAFIMKPSPVGFFEGIVASVDVETGTVTLESGLLVKLTDDSEIVDADHGIRSLDEVAALIAEDHKVIAAGIGHVVGADPPTVIAIQVLFIVAAP